MKDTQLLKRMKLLTQREKKNKDYKMEFEMMKNKKMIVIIIILVIVACAGIVLSVYLRNKPKNNPEDVLMQYANCINTQKYEEMYTLITTDSKNEISQEDFIKRNKNIYEGIEIENFNIEIKNIEKSGKNSIKITYKNSMDTMSGHIEFNNVANLEKNSNKEYEIKWSSNLIFPKLNEEDKVRVKTLEAKRGCILDRNGEYLATNGVASQIGLVPGKMSENKEEDIAKIAELLNQKGVSVARRTITKYREAIKIPTAGKRKIA